MFKKAIPYILAVVAFIVAAYAYTPQVFSGKVVNQSDISSWKGMAGEIVSYNEAHPGDRALWTNSMFGGMPATTISVIYEGDVTKPLYDFLLLGERPASYLLISMLGAFLLFLAFGVSVPLAAFGAIAVTFCSYNMQIIQVGHNTKMLAIAFMPWVLAAVVHAYRNSALWGSIFFAFALSFQIKANHPQISYYLAMIILGFAIWQLCSAISQKAAPRFIKTSALLLVAGAVGIATNINHLWPTYEYSGHSMRGGSELVTSSTMDSNSSTNNGNVNAGASAAEKAGKKSRSGLDLEYATQWSYGPGETLNLLIPDLYGGASAGALSTKSETYKLLTQNGYSQKQAQQTVQALPLYWGPQPFTAGPMYMGALTIFLCILGFFVLKGGVKWWTASVGIIAILLSWGYHFMPMSELFFNWMPMYNKFRTVSMILVILQMLIPIMAVLALDKVLYPEKESDVVINGKGAAANGGKESAISGGRTGVRNDASFKKGLLWSLGITGGISLILWLIPSLAGDFAATSDSQLPDVLAQTLAADRMALLRSDALRSLIFILLGAAAIWGCRKGWFKRGIALTALIALVLIDLWGIDKRYLNDSHFVTQQEFGSPLEKRAVDEMILEDTDLDYRVLDLSVNTFNNSYTSYHHKTIGGYSPAKIQRYQDMIDYYITPEISAIYKELEGVSTFMEAQERFGNHPVLNMLNTRYVILGADNPPLVNSLALGNAWFVSNLIGAENANEEIAMISAIDVVSSAVVAQSTIDAEDLAQWSADAQVPQFYAPSSIELVEYSPNRMVYSFSSFKRQPAIFSEIYYSPGWKAYIAGQEVPIFRANYILRGVMVPQGEGTIEFLFDPECFSKGELYSKASSWLLIIVLLGAASLSILRRKRSGQKESSK